MTGALYWNGSQPPRADAAGVREALACLDQARYLVRLPGSDAVGVAGGGSLGRDSGYELLAVSGPLPPTRIGAAAFRDAHSVRYAYQAGAMANGIASEDMVIALARAGLLGTFGAAGLLPERIEKAIDRFETEIPGLPYAANLIHNPMEQALEQATVEVYLRRGVRCVEASAYLDLTPHVVRYRLSGLRRDRTGRVTAGNRVIAKVSRAEVAEQFMRPAPEQLVSELRAAGLVTEEQAEAARWVPMADDVTVEADSAGHTDRRPLTVSLPSLLRQRGAAMASFGYRDPIRVGAAGGIGTPEAVAAAFAAGADYVVTGSVNQSCREAGTSAAVKAMLAGAGVADCAMAPAADMFEIGAELQVLRRGTMFAMRAAKLRELYRAYDGLDDLPAAERAQLESQILRRPVSQVWDECVAYFSSRDPQQVTRAQDDPKRRMALVFRWYLGSSSHWANAGDPDRTLDYQIWCGPAMGAFNDWVRGSHLAAPENRGAVEVAEQLLAGGAFHLRLAQLRAAGAEFAHPVADYRPAPPKPQANPTSQEETCQSQQPLRMSQ